ncbi:hypothetical protein AZL_d03790 (plasmid) [Azospirillum sp. B510]|uniref:hypothetical protein n=1 Tax=Azospirillum sp. (strain B510) TaxID=137722 RepID=UPI0001C4C90A|nr:hypothetical protein [Azospirillum sp. B510]BAI76205.1 hypothetical protein AZL_d03790 [Azospirillum sp. B510]
MAENDHIAAQAELLASELFEEFFWQKTGPTNHDWPCEDQARHGAKTHPCDVVYYYDEPYDPARTYVHCDLKSYAKGSISANAVKAAVHSLAKQIACAEKSNDWRDKHVHRDANAWISGLLFVYNHDGEYDKNFQDTLLDIQSSALDIPKGSKLVVLGPKEIFWLDNIKYELLRMRGKSNPDLPPHDHCSFFYPELSRRARLRVKTARSATLEMLTSPIITLKYQFPKLSHKKGFVVFYSRKGETEDEFMYLIDIIRKNDLFGEQSDVIIKTLNPSENSSPNFQKAQKRYIESLPIGAEATPLAEYVNAIRYEPISQIKTSYSPIDLGTWS